MFLTKSKTENKNEDINEAFALMWNHFKGLPATSEMPPLGKWHKSNYTQSKWHKETARSRRRRWRSTLEPMPTT